MSLARPTTIGISLPTGVFTLNGVLIDGWAQDESAYETEKKTYINFFIGADGNSVGIPTGDKSENINIKLLQNSPSVSFLNSIISNVKAGTYTAVQGKFFDPRSGSTHDLGKGFVFAGKTFISMGINNQGVMDYDLFFGNTTSVINNSNFTF